MSEQQEERLRQLYRRSRQESPAAATDARVRAAASRAVSRRSGRWLWGLSAAAVVILSFNLVLDLLRFDEPVMLPKEEMGAAPTAARMAEPESRESVEAIKPARAGRAMMPPSVEKRKAAELSRMDRLLDSADIDSAAGVKLEEAAEPETIPPPRDTSRVVVPLLPTGAVELKGLAENLMVETAPDGRISVYTEEKLILNVEAVDGQVRFKAWQGVEILGVVVDWSTTPDRLQRCVSDNAYLSCMMGDRVRGYFESRRLDHIAWTVAADE